MEKEISPYILNIISTSISGLSAVDDLSFPLEEMRFEAIKAMVQNLLQQLQQIGIRPRFEALQINETQVFSFSKPTPEIIPVEQANLSDQRYISLEYLKQTFNLSLNIREFQLGK